MLKSAEVKEKVEPKSKLGQS